MPHIRCLVSGSADAILALVNAGANVEADDKDGLTGKYDESILTFATTSANVRVIFYPQYFPFCNLYLCCCQMEKNYHSYVSSK